jgi:hypothetical protein
MQTPPVHSAVEGKIIALQSADLHLILSTIVPLSPRPPAAAFVDPDAVDVRRRVHWQDGVCTKLTRLGGFEPGREIFCAVNR